MLRSGNVRPRGPADQASAAGQAKEIKEHPFYGLYLLLEHPGMETCYVRREVLVEEGEVVEQGQVVAEIKLNPYQNRASFYFEIRDKGEPVDPLPLIIE